MNIRNGSRRNIVRYSVTVKVPANHLIRVLFGFFLLVNRPAYDLTIAAGNAVNDISVFVIKVCPGPLIAVNNHISVIPTREVFIPAEFILQGFYINSNPR